MSVNLHGRVKKTLKIAGISLVSLVVIAIASSVWIFRSSDKVKSIVITELNRSLRTEISVQDIDFVVFKSFPFISVQFRNVLAKEVYNPFEKNDTLFYAESIAFKFNAIDIIKGRYQIRRLDVNDGVFYMKYFADSIPNYIFWKSSSKEADSTFLLTLSKIGLQNVRYVYHNEVTQQHYDILIEKGNAKGNFGALNQHIELEGDLKINHFQTNDFVLFRQMPAKVNIHFEHQGNTSNIRVTKGSLELQKLLFSVSGNLCYASDSSYINVDIQSKNLLLEQVIKNLPEKVGKFFDGYKSSGILDLSVNIGGKLTSKRLPLITAQASIKNGTLSGKNVPLNFRKINFSASYTNGERQSISSSSLMLHRFSAYTDEGFIEGKLNIHNFSNPIVDADLKASINLEKLQSFLKIKQIEKLKGHLDIDLKLKGSLKDLQNTSAYALNKVNMKGTAKLSNMNLKMESYMHAIENLNTTLVFNNQKAELSGTHFQISKSQVSMNGEVQNILPFIFLKEQSLQFSADVACDNLIFDNFLPAKNKTQDETVSESTWKLALPQYLTANVRFSTDRFSYKNMKAENVKAVFQLNKGIFSIKDLQIASLGGNIAGDLLLESLPNEKRMQIKGSMDLKKININQLFQTFDNFGQQTIAAENIAGQITANVTFLTVFGEQGIDLKRLKVVSDTKIENGALLNFKPLERLSHFVEEEALSNIHFKTLSNTFSVQNETFEIPLMEIQSNAISFWISGKQKFSGEMDYHLKIKFSELSSKKQKARLQKEQKEFGTFEEDNSGQLVLYILITGTVDKPIFKYDSKSAKKQFKENLKEEVQSLKTTLKKELDPQYEQTKREKENLKKQEQGNYIIEWEEKPNQDTVKKKKPKETKFNVEWE